MSRLIFEYAKLIRLTGLGGLSLAPIFGAISLIETGITIDLKIILILFVLGIFKSIFGFVQNDYADIELDKLSEDTKTRPLVTGTISKRAAIAICLFCFIATFVTIFAFFYRNHITFYIALLCIIISAIIGSIYNYWGKKFIFSAFIAALADALYVIVGAYLISTELELSIYTWVIFILVYTQFLFMTIIIGGVKDADHDYLLNVKNFAIASGVKITKNNKLIIPIKFKLFAFGIRLFSAFIIFVPFIFFDVIFQIWHIFLLLLFVIPVLALTVKLLNIETMEKMDEVTKLAGLQGVLRYCFIPILLIPVIGLLYSLVLIVFPLIWYIIFTPFTGKKMFKQLM